jgi:hypothetical protein
MYTDQNFKTKKALKDAVARGEHITCFQPGPFGNARAANGTAYLEGPHYPEPHRWYAQAEVRDGRIVKIK